jgi:hypothetical protein
VEPTEGNGGERVSWFTTRFESRGAHVCKKQCHARDMRIYIGSGSHKDNNPTFCVCRCIMICWVETPSTPPFIGQGVEFIRKIQVDIQDLSLLA